MMTDAELVRHSLAGRADAFDALVGRHYGRCLRYAGRLLGNREDAEEAVQDSFVRAFKALDRYAESDRFTAWLFRILLNRCRSRVARRRGMMEVATDCETLALLSPSCDDGAATLGLRDALAHAFAQLDGDQREAVLLKHVDDLTYEEMSVITGVTVPALKMRVNRACARLRHLLAEVR